MATNKNRKKKTPIHIMDRITNINKALISVKSLKLENSEMGADAPLTPIITGIYKINEFNDQTANITVNISAGFRPSAIINVDFEYSLDVTFSECIKRDEFEDQIENVISILGADVTLFVGLISEKMFSNPLIIPPFVQIKK